MRRIAGACSLAVPLLCLAATADGADWRQWRGNNRDGAAERSPALIEGLPSDGLRPRWRSESIPSGGTGGWGSPAIADGKVYLFVHTKTRLGEPPQKQYPWLPDDKRVGMTPEEYAEYERNRRDEDELIASFFRFEEIVYCLDAADGRTLWKNVAPSVYTRFLQSGSPAVIDGRLYVLGAGRRARAIDAVTGQDIWETRLPGEFRDEYMMSSFAVVDGVAVVLCGHLAALDAASGKLLWQGDPKTTSGIHTSPVAWGHNGQMYIVANVTGKQTACFELRTGRELWRVDSEANHSTPVVVGNRLLTYGTSRGAGLRCYVMSPGGAELAWMYRRVADKGSSPVVVGDHVYVQGEKRLACVELASGSEAWNILMDVAQPQYTSLIAADGKVIYACDGVLCVAADPSEYRPLMEAKINREGLLAAEETLRQLLKLNEVEREPDGLEKSLRIYEREIRQQGPLACASPAIADGKLYVRVRNGILCYDLTAPRQAAQR